ncbi:MAG: DUF2062 domain-containing protein [Firmicutes bacterium]|nr:DUF2062 domain-containing protein [Bacillota bacterium]
MTVRRLVRYYLLKFLRLNGSPRKVALGFALGVCMNFYPTFGFGLALAVVLAGVMRANIAASLLGDTLFKWLFPVFFYLNYVVGEFLIDHPAGGLAGTSSSVWEWSRHNLTQISQAFFLGMVLNTLILGTTLYFLTHWLILNHRRQLLRFLLRRRRPV